MLQVQGLSVSYGKASALHRVSMEVNEGEIVAVIGPNGAGKTTLLKAVTGLLKVKSGTTHHESGRLVLPSGRTGKGIRVAGIDPSCGSRRGSRERT